MSLFSRITVWTKNQTLKSADLNGEFNNIINNMIPQSIVGYEATVNQMRIQTDPGSEGSENQGVSLSDEIERLRFVISRAVGGTYWYDNPNTSLESLSTLLATAVAFSPNRLVSGAVNSDGQPAFLLPHTGSDNEVLLSASVTNLQGYIKNTIFTAASNLTATLSGPGTFTCKVNDATMAGQAASKTQGENGTQLLIGTLSGTAPANGSYQAWKIVDGSTTEYFFGRYNSTVGCIDKAKRGYFFDHTGTTIKRTAINNADNITLCRAAYVFFTNPANVNSLAVTYNEPVVSFTAPTSPNAGDWWLDLSSGGVWRVFSGGVFIDGNGIYIGVACVDGSTVIGTRSKDFDRSFSNLNTVSLELEDTADVWSVGQGNRISVYGNSFEFTRTTLKWNASANLDTGVTIGDTSTYYLYLTQNGEPFISDQRPYDSTGSLLGYYHPYKPWRCVGSIVTDGSANFLTLLTFDYLGIPPAFIDQTRLGVAPMSVLSLATPTNNQTQLLLTTSYQTLATLVGGTTTLNLNNRKVLVFVNFSLINSSGEAEVLIQVLRGSTVVRTYAKFIESSGVLAGCNISDVFLDSGAEGSTEYSLQALYISLSGSPVVYMQPIGATGTDGLGSVAFPSFAKLAGNQSAVNGTASGINMLEVVEL